MLPAWRQLREGEDKVRREGRLPPGQSLTEKFPVLHNGRTPRYRPEARFVIQHCEGGYTTNLPLSVMLQPNVLLATHFDGKPLTPDHGYPLRVVIGTFPDRDEGNSAYFWKGGKWLRALEFRASDQPGFWERAGYHNDADPWHEQRYGHSSY